MVVDLTQRQRRWLDALLILSTIAVGFVVAGFVGDIFFEFGDIVLVFFLAWLLAFILSPLVTIVRRRVPALSHIGAVVVVYAILLGGLTLVIVLVSNALLVSIQDFVETAPTLKSQLPELLAPWQERLAGLGLGNVNLTVQATIFLDNLNRYAAELAGPLQQIAIASLGAIGNLLFVLILSLYMVADRDRIVSFLFRLVPPGFKAEAALLERSVSRSFGGFLRGQALLGLIYAGVAFLTSAVLGLDYLPVTTALSGILHAIPFFGPFISWAPPVLVAIFTKPEVALIAFTIMMIGWFIVMNVVQPRLMEEAVGIHPIVVLGSVLVGAKVAGFGGAVFGIPVAAVLSAFFFHYVNLSRDQGPVAERAARRLEEREGRPVRLPREPDPEVDPDIDDVGRDPAAPPAPAR